MSYFNHWAAVIGIDFGTTFSGWSFLTRTKPIPERRRMKWAGSERDYVKHPTALLYGPDGKLVENAKWGWAAVRTHAHMGPEAKEYALARHFKMRLFSPTDGISDSGYPLYKASNGKLFSVVQLISDYLHLLKNDALEQIPIQRLDAVSEKDILWCVSVPAIWDDKAKGLMKEAAREAKLIDGSPGDTDRLVFGLEPEVAAVYCRFDELRSPQLTDGTRFMVVDCGGGTADITAYVVDGKALRQIGIAGGGPYGSTYIDIAFISLLEETFSKEALNEFLDLDHGAFYEDVILSWERRKLDYDPGVDREISSFKLPFDLYTFLQRFHPDRLSNISNGRLAFSMADLFKPVLDAIEQEIKAVLHDKELASCDYMFLVGGLSESPLLEKRIRGAFEGKVKKIVFPEKPSAAVVDGAALFGMDPSVVRSRKSRLTYGAASLEVFEDGRDPESRKVIGERGPRCKGRFAIYVVAGQSIEHDQPVPMVFKPLESSQDGMHFDLYATADTSPRYVDDPGSQLIGSFDVAMPDLTGGLDRKVNMVMYFGQTEIRAKATDLTSNRSSEIGNIEFHYFF